MTSIEVIAEAIREFEPDDYTGLKGAPVVDEVLVPEQCMIVYIDGKPYHVTIEEMSE